MSVVLIGVRREGFSEAEDFGTGIVFAHNEDQSFVLTCHHVPDPEKSPAPSLKILGQNASVLESAQLKELDLAVITTPRLKIRTCTFSSTVALGTELQCEGYRFFVKRSRFHQIVMGTLSRIAILENSDSETVSRLLVIQAKPNGDQFTKGMSGGPAFDQLGNVVGVISVIENKVGGENTGYAVSISDEIVNCLYGLAPGGQVADLPTTLARPVEKAASIPSAETSPTKTLAPSSPPPREASLAKGDVQKNRWGGRKQGFGRRLYITNVRGEHRYFEFDAVLESIDGSPLRGPFYFHLHDSYEPNKIRVMKTLYDGKQAILHDVGADGTYTIGVQFKDAANIWRSLEYDLISYAHGSLRRYDNM